MYDYERETEPEPERDTLTQLSLLFCFPSTSTTMSKPEPQHLLEAGKPALAGRAAKQVESTYDQVLIPLDFRLKLFARCGVLK